MRFSLMSVALSDRLQLMRKQPLETSFESLHVYIKSKP